MRTFVTFFFLLSVNYTLFAQSLQYLNTQDKKKIKELPVILNYENSSGEKGQSFFEYDGNNLLRKGKWELTDHSRHSINYYFYNEKGQLIEFYREFSDGFTGCIKFEYNGKGKLILETFSRSDGVTGSGEYFYTENGLLKKIVANKMKGWFTGEIIYEKPKENFPGEATIFMQGKGVGKILYSYKNNKLIKEHWDFPGRWSQTFEWGYISESTLYTSSNVFIHENSRFRLNKEIYDFNKQNGGPSFFEYDPSGKLVQKVFIRSDSLKTFTRYKYDANGFLRKSTRKYNDGKIGSFKYEWNKFRKLLTRRFYIDDKEISSEKYFYNAIGKLDSAQWNNFDTWLTGTITFDYSRTGQVSKGYFKGKNRFDAEIEFTYDTNSNLEEIHWIFSFGKKQTYHFEYEKFY